MCSAEVALQRRPRRRVGLLEGADEPRAFAIGYGAHKQPKRGIDARVIRAHDRSTVVQFLGPAEPLGPGPSVRQRLWAVATRGFPAIPRAWR